jgi:hypothetical protein
MIDVANKWEDGDENALVKVQSYEKKSYLSWNKDTVKMMLFTNIYMNV